MSSRPVFLALVAAGVVGISLPLAGQDLRELARQRALKSPIVPIQVPAPPADYTPRPLEQLAKKALAVVRTKLVRLNSYLGSSGDRVLTDYAMTEPIVIAGGLPVSTAKVPGAAAQLTLTVFGGEIVIEGVPVRSIDTNRAPIKDGAEHVVFLRSSRQPGAGRYEVYYGGIFEVSEGRVKPLLTRPESAFEGPVGPRLADLVVQIRHPL